MKNYYLKLFSFLIGLSLLTSGAIYYVKHKPVELSDLVSVKDLWYTHDNLLFTGDFISHTFEGKIFSTGSIKGGEMNGIITTYYDSEEIQSLCDYQNGFLVNACKEFDEQGNLITKKP